MDKKEKEKKGKQKMPNLKGDDYPFELEEEDYVIMVYLQCYFSLRLTQKRESGILQEESLTMPSPLAMETGKSRVVVTTSKSFFVFVSNTSLFFKHCCQHSNSR